MKIPTLSSVLDELEIHDVPDREIAFLSLSEKGDSIAKYRVNREFLTNSISILESSGEFVFWDLRFYPSSDVIKNIKFENVHHYQFVSNGVPFNKFPEEIVLVAMPYCEPAFRVYFRKTNIPSTFTVEYDCLLVPNEKRDMLRKGVQTENHVYSDGVIFDRKD